MQDWSGPFKAEKKRAAREKYDEQALVSHSTNSQNDELLRLLTEPKKVQTKAALDEYSRARLDAIANSQVRKTAAEARISCWLLVAGCTLTVGSFLSALIMLLRH
jgi:hypothetical protein